MGYKRIEGAHFLQSVERYGKEGTETVEVNAWFGDDESFDEYVNKVLPHVLPNFHYVRAVHNAITDGKGNAMGKDGTYVAPSKAFSKGKRIELGNGDRGKSPKGNPYIVVKRNSGDKYRFKRYKCINGFSKYVDTCWRFSERGALKIAEGTDDLMAVPLIELI